jgi:short-subunit dehydrogenase
MMSRSGDKLQTLQEHLHKKDIVPEFSVADVADTLARNSCRKILDDERGTTAS